MEIVPVEKDDAKEIVQMILAEFPYARITEEKFLKRLGRRGIRAFKAVEEKKILGYLELEKTEPMTARINAIIVNTDFRGKGIGKKILDFALDFLKKKNIRRIILQVKQSNAEAKKIYAEAGFQFIGLLENKIDNETIEEFELSLREENEEMPSYVG